MNKYCKVCKYTHDFDCNERYIVHTPISELFLIQNGFTIDIENVICARGGVDNG